MKLYIYILLFFVFCSIGKSFSQGYYYHQFEASVNHGFTLPHRSDLGYLIRNRINSGGITYSHKTDGMESWHHEWRFPEVGAGYLMTELGNFSVLGYAHSLFGFIGIPVIENNNFTLKYRLGMGLAYLTEKYDFRTNYYNIAIGSNLNAHIHFSVLADIRPWNVPLYIVIGTTYNHFSNAAVKKPNLGLNLMSLNSGIKYMFSDYDYVLPKRTFFFMNTEYYFTTYYAIGSRQNTTYENVNYTVQSLVGDFTIKINQKRAFGIGTNIVFDPSLKTQIIDSDENKYNGRQDLFRLGFHLVQDVFFTDYLACVIQIGTYAYNKHSDNNNFSIYNRLGIRYIFNDFFVANFMIRSHTSVADFAEIGIGYRLHI